MFGCNWGSPFPYNVIGILINILMVVMIVYVITLTIKSFFAKNTLNKDTADSLEIIKRKFASGEISQSEFQRMKEILTG